MTFKIRFEFRSKDALTNQALSNVRIQVIIAGTTSTVTTSSSGSASKTVDTAQFPMAVRYTATRFDTQYRCVFLLHSDLSCLLPTTTSPQ